MGCLEILRPFETNIGVAIELMLQTELLSLFGGMNVDRHSGIITIMINPIRKYLKKRRGTSKSDDRVNWR